MRLPRFARNDRKREACNNKEEADSGEIEAGLAMTHYLVIARSFAVARHSRSKPERDSSLTLGTSSAIPTRLPRLYWRLFFNICWLMQ